MTTSRADEAPSIAPLAPYSPVAVAGGRDGRLEKLPSKKLLKRAASARKPIFAASGEQDAFAASHPDYASTWPVQIQHAPEPEHEVLKPGGKGGSYQVSELLICAFVPPLVFSYIAALLTFGTHYDLGWAVYPLAALAILALVPSLHAARKTKAGQDDASGGHRLQLFLLLAAILGASISAELNYWYCMKMFYTLRSMKAYTNIDPAITLGERVMDAATITFTNTSRPVADLAMSYTAEDIYCAAPIGSGSAADRLQRYDFWAVGVDCCRSGAGSGFGCGEFQNGKAHSGMRLALEAQLPYYRLAVQQAEAAFAIEAPHPIFVHWVQDAEREEILLYQAGIHIWVMAGCLHLGFNFFAMAVYFVVLYKPPRKTRAYDSVI